MNGILTDARTEWAVRWTALTMACYSLLFYNAGNVSWIDWTLPIQLAQGGNLGFYNYGWHYWFGLAAALGLVVGGCLTSIVFPLLQRERIVGAYFVLMTLLTLIIVPCAAYVGVLSTLTGIFLLVIVIFVENIYVPVLDLRTVLPDQASIWSQVIQGSVVACLVYLALSWGIYMLPPWHSGSTQALRLASATAQGIADALKNAADELRKYRCDGTATKDPKEKLQALGSALFQGTNFAGLAVPIKLYASMGGFELSPLYPLTSLNYTAVEALSARLDEAAYHSSVMLSILGHTEALGCCLGDEKADKELLLALVSHFEASAALAEASATVLQVERKQDFGREMSKCSAREKIVLNERLWEWKGRAADGKSALEALEKARKEGMQAAEELRQRVLMCSSMKAHATLLWAVVRDTTNGSRPLAHFMDTSNSTEDSNEQTTSQGALGRLSDASLVVQDSWNGSMAPLRQMKRSFMLEQLEQLACAWLRGNKAAYNYIFTSDKLQKAKRKSLLNQRGVRRAVQWIVGTYSLYAMATWWEDFRTMFGSSSAGPWTMVAFYVCFRPSVEETVNVAVLRSFGHGLGAILAWAVNANVPSRGGLMAVHAALTFVLTWMIPTPFTYPTSFTFKWDRVVGSGLVEGILTTYHLTSSVVLVSNPASAAKARAASQCIGSATAGLVSILILPWWADSRSRTALEDFHRMVMDIIKVHLRKDELNSSMTQLRAAVNDLLECRRDLATVLESKWLGGILRSFGVLRASESIELERKLLAAILGGVALESVIGHMQGLALPPEVTDAFQCGDAIRAANLLLDAIPLASNDHHSDILASCHVSFIMMGKTGLFSPSEQDASTA